MKLRNGFAALTVTGILAAATVALAQQQPAAPAQPGRATQGKTAGTQNGDQMLATCVTIENQKEVALAKFGQEKANHEDVKEFAAMLVKDHQAMLEKLKCFAPDAGSDQYLRQETTSRVQPATGAKPVVTGSNATTIDPIQLHQELAQQCLMSMKEKLDKKDGKEFDECFIGSQIAGHMAMINELTVFEKHATGELKQLFATGREKAETHLEQAESIMKQLSGKDSDSPRKKSTAKTTESREKTE